MDVFPAFVPLAGRTVVVVGDGEAAEAKARLFDGSPARLVCIKGEAAFDRDAYAGAALAFIAGPEPFAMAAASAARSAGVPVNVVDRPVLSDFQTPSIVDRGAVVGALGTGGAAPGVAAELRGAVEASWPAGLGRVAELLRRLQPEVRARYPGLLARRVILRQLIDGPAARQALAGEMDTALDLARAAFETSTPPRGLLQLLRAPDTLERLTLGELRALGRADRIVADLTSSDPIVADLLDMARRDAPRRERVESSSERLAAWTAAGEIVVRIIGGGDDAADVQAARAIDVPIVDLGLT